MKFCLKIDHFYLDRALALLESIKKFHKSAHVFVLALTDETYAFLSRLNLPQLTVVPLRQLTESEPRIEALRVERTEAEFAFTMTPFAVLETMQLSKKGEFVVYVDTDALFFGSCSAVLSRYNEKDVLLTKHNFSEHMSGQKRFGIFNTGFTAFRNTEGGYQCAKWWAEKCLEWCHDKLDGDRFTDQKYLERFSSVTDNIGISDSIGLNSAPWNSSHRRFARHCQQTLVDGEPLVFYHFAKVHRVSPRCISTRLKLQGVIGAKGLIRHVYQPYARALACATRRYSIPREWTFGKKSFREGSKQQRLAQDDNPGLFKLVTGIVTGKYAVAH